MPVGPWGAGTCAARTFCAARNGPVRSRGRMPGACKRAQRKRWDASDWGAPRHSAHCRQVTRRQKDERATGHTGSGRRTASAVLGSPRSFSAGSNAPVPVPPGSPDGRAGRRADRVRRTWRGLRGLRSGSLRAGRLALPLQCDEACTPLSGCTAWARAVCGDHTHTPSRCAVRDRQAYGTCTCLCIYAHMHCMCARNWLGWPG
jgi:hypothetical protein